jgi:pyruvate formate lyase activating enzyme
MPRTEGSIAGRERSPESIVARALQSDSRTIAYTYTEPTIFFEFAFDTAGLAKKRGIGNVLVSNGYMSSDCLALLPGLFDAANIDLKSMRDDFYKNSSGGRLQPVLDGLKTMKDSGIWVEVTTLLIPGLNDSDEELTDMAGFIASLGTETPWHISRFHPLYKMLHKPPTPAETLHHAARIGKEAGLKYVYTGNIPGDAGENTFCPSCGRMLIERFGFRINRIDMAGGACPGCKTPLDGIF